MVLITNSSLKLASIKYISKAEHSKYLRGFYKYLQCLKKNSGELRSAPCTWHQNPCSPFPVTWMQWLAESVPALMGNLCRCSQDRVTHISELRVGLGTRRLRHSWCQEGGGGESLSQHELLSLNSWQDTRHFSKGKLIKSWMGEAGKGGSDQRAGDNAMCHLPCSLLFSRILCHYSGLYVCYNIPNMKFTVFVIFSTQLSGIKYIHVDVQPSPPSISTTLLWPQH